MIKYEKGLKHNDSTRTYLLMNAKINKKNLQMLKVRFASIS